MANYAKYLRATYPSTLADADTRHPAGCADSGADAHTDGDPVADGSAVQHPDPVPVDRGRDTERHCGPANTHANPDGDPVHDTDADDPAVRNGDGWRSGYGLPSYLLVGPDDVRGV